MTDRDRVISLALAYSEENQCDVALCNGPMGFGLDSAIHDRFREKKFSNVLLILTTEGGDAHVAYRVARFLQRTYDNVQVCVSGWCKSAGTLLAVCGNELIVGDRGELGPLDVQRGRTDDLWKSTSGLTESSALSNLEEVAWSMFRKLVTETKDLSDSQMTFKTASEAAAPLVVGMLTPIFAQIDPLKLGENARELNVASEYASRLNEHSKNLKEGSHDRLVSNYPDHGFVIDRKEAETLFERVHSPNAKLQEIIDAMGAVALYPQFPPLLNIFRKEDQEETGNGEHEANPEERGGGKQEDASETHQEPTAAVETIPEDSNS